MEFGIAIFATDTTLQPIQLARTVEDLGFDSLWLSEHSHIPASRQTPRGGVEGAPPLPEKYWRTHDVLVALAAAAAVTERIELGTGVTLLAQRDPIWTAKEIATLDHLSNGRVVLGLGYGWNKEEMASHGVAYRDRRAMLREHVLTMKALWTEETASFHGQFVDLEPSWAWPKPVQKPHPPILLGGTAGPRTIADLVEFCDGWVPLRRNQLGEAIDSVLQALEQAGRDPAAFDLSYFNAPPDEAFVEELRDLGFRRTVLAVESDEPAIVTERLGELAEFVDRVGR